MTSQRWGMFLAVVFVLFLGLETWAIKTGTPTLSMTIYLWSQAYPILPFTIGSCVGGLVMHFWGRTATEGQP